MKLGYIRKRGNGPSIAKQEEALIKAGISDFSVEGPVYRDTPKPGTHRLTAEHLVERQALLRCLHKGDEIVVADYPTMFLSPLDAMQVVEEIARSKASLRVVEDGEIYEWKPSDADIAARLAQLSQKTQAAITSEITAKARRARNATGNLGGRPPSVDRDALKAAGEAWCDPNGPSPREIVEQYGISRTTLVRHFQPISQARANVKSNSK
jgi:DNA invertase Pin-like site-specific DNA recombinase